LLQRWGRGANAFQILEQGFTHWFGGPATDPTVVVGYVQVGRCRVVAGTPICADDRLADSIRAFVEAGRQKKYDTVFVGVEAQFLPAFVEAGISHDVIKIGEQPEWDPSAYDLDCTERRSLRAQVNRARNKGVKVRRIQAEDIARAPGSLRAEIEHILQRWLTSRRMGVLRFMVDLEPFTHPEQRRYYVAEQGDRSVAFLAAVPVFQRKGWFFEDVIRVPEAPNGAVELLIHTAMEDAREQGDEYVTLGVSPLRGLTDEAGPHPRTRRLLEFMGERLGFLYDFGGLESFKIRFRPDRWVSQYAVASPGPTGIKTARAITGAFVPGGFPSFIGQSIRRMLARISARRWSSILQLLAVLLIPWTILLGVVDGAHWFGDVSIQKAWVAFDVAMTIGLFGLARLVGKARPSGRRFSMFLAGATIADFVLSLFQALHLHRAVTGWSSLFVILGVSGPLVATAVLVSIALVAPVKPVARNRHRDL
jgi:phosphatidylglycerol lysyltransferase